MQPFPVSLVSLLSSQLPALQVPLSHCVFLFCFVAESLTTILPHQGCLCPMAYGSEALLYI